MNASSQQLLKKKRFESSWDFIALLWLFFICRTNSSIICESTCHLYGQEKTDWALVQQGVHTLRPTSHSQLSRRWDLSGYLNLCWLTTSLYYGEARQFRTRNKEEWAWEDAEGSGRESASKRSGAITRWAKATKETRPKEALRSWKHLQFRFVAVTWTLAYFCWPKIPPWNSICRP